MASINGTTAMVAQHDYATEGINTAVAKLRKASATYLKCLFDSAAAAQALSQAFQDCCIVLQEGNRTSSLSSRTALSSPTSLGATARNLGVASTTVTQGPEQAFLRERMAKQVQCATDTDATITQLHKANKRLQNLIKKVEKQEAKAPPPNSTSSNSSSGCDRKAAARRQQLEARRLECRELERAVAAQHGQLLRATSTWVEECMCGYATAVSMLAELTAQRFRGVVAPGETARRTTPDPVRTVSQATQTPVAESREQRGSAVASPSSSLLSRLRNGVNGIRGAYQDPATAVGRGDGGGSGEEGGHSQLQGVPCYYATDTGTTQSYEWAGAALARPVASGVPVVRTAVAAMPAYREEPDIAASPDVAPTTYSRGCYYVSECSTTKEVDSGRYPSKRL